MSLTTDVKAYADAALDAAVEQGKQALEAAHASLGKLQSNLKSIDSLGPQADGLREAIEPYVLTALGYGNHLASRVETVVADLKKDKRFAQVVEGTEAFATAVVGAVQERLTKAAESAAASASAVQGGVTKVAETAAASASSVWSQASGAGRGKSSANGSSSPRTATKPAAATKSTAKSAARSTVKSATKATKSSAASATAKSPATKSASAIKATTTKATGTKAAGAKASPRKSAGVGNAKAVQTAKVAPAAAVHDSPVANHTTGS
jgi:hypothetical protein